MEGGRRPGRRPGPRLRGGRPPAHGRPAVVPLRPLRLPGRADAEHHRPRPREFYQQALDAFAKVFEIADPATSRVEIPFEGTTLPAYFSNASKRRRARAVRGHVERPGLHQGAHVHVGLAAGDARARHLGADGRLPRSGEALRFQDLKSRIETEDWAKAYVDWLETRSDVDHDQIGLAGWSLGGYYCPRAAAFEKLQARRGLGRQPQLGRGAEEATPARGREPGAALLGARALGVGLRGRREVHRVRRGRQPQRRRRQDHRPVPHRPRRERPADLGRLRPPVLRPGGQQPEAGAADLHRRGGRGRARRPRPHAAHQRVRRRLGRGHLPRARHDGSARLARAQGRPDHGHRRRPGCGRGRAVPGGRRDRGRL